MVCVRMAGSLLIVCALGQAAPTSSSACRATCDSCGPVLADFRDLAAAAGLDRAHGHRRRTDQGLHPRNHRRRRRRSSTTTTTGGRTSSWSTARASGLTPGDAPGEPPVSEQRRRHVHRRDREGGRRRAADGARASAPATTTTTATSICSSPTTAIRCSIATTATAHSADVTRASGLSLAEPALEYRRGLPGLRSRRPPGPVRVGLRRLRGRDSLPAREPHGLLLERASRVMCGPQGLAGSQNTLFRGNGDGTFSDVSENARAC